MLGSYRSSSSSDIEGGGSRGSGSGYRSRIATLLFSMLRRNKNLRFEEAKDIRGRVCECPAVDDIQMKM
ncbi:unnamed protein product [Linum trigynum]|uniref:Uncharacterized protein n=1 Tax=Linum trigynum TaxID=586398 RepID=A0AAV2GM47_9ROSI